MGELRKLEGIVLIFLEKQPKQNQYIEFFTTNFYFRRNTWRENQSLSK